MSLANTTRPIHDKDPGVRVPSVEGDPDGTLEHHSELYPQSREFLDILLTSEDVREQFATLFAPDNEEFPDSSLHLPPLPTLMMRGREV